jgi:hypothetical protein
MLDGVAATVTPLIVAVRVTVYVTPDGATCVPTTTVTVLDHVVKPEYGATTPARV